MTVQGKPAALIAITAVLTIIAGLTVLTTRNHPQPVSYPQSAPQPVDNSFREMNLLRASRHRSVPPKRINTKNHKLQVPLVAASPRSTKPVTRHVRKSGHPLVFTSASAWAHTTDAIKVANCESGDRHSWSHYNGDPTLHDGPYTGKWQIGHREWLGAGGTGYPWQASVAEQDYRAWILWKARGWQPWTCARIMGIT